VAQTLKGDSTEYAMLMAAMCRAEGIPARTVVGFAYAEVKDRPAFIWCMWTEVWVRGVWMPLDATQGRGGVGATYLKIADQSWHKERSATPLLPMLRVLDRVTIEVIRTDATMGQTAPIVTWNNPADIVVGAALDDTQLNATANVPGTFSYKPAAGTVLGLGNKQTLSVTFTPTATTDYSTVTRTVSINVVQAGK
jgi:hypothetical protein